MHYSIILFFVVFLTKKTTIVASANLMARTNDYFGACDQSNLLNDVEVNAFIDENRYIRLNVSWGEPTGNFSTFDLVIDTNCSALYGSRSIPVQIHHVIVPDMERLKHPAEPLLHGCSYTFEFSTQAALANQTCMLKQVADYRIAECVEGICDCTVATAPFELFSHQITQNGTYGIKFKKTDKTIDLSIAKVFDKMWITSMTLNKTVILIHPDQLVFDNNNDIVYVKFPNVMVNDEDYMVFIDLLADRCEYHSYFKLDQSDIRNHLSARKVPVPNSIIYVIIISVLLFVSLLITMKRNPKLQGKIKSYLPFTKASVNPPIATADMTNKLRKEVINTQYTPLEFVQNGDKLDDFEIPRNKIILKGELGGGAFGKVYEADVYDIYKKSEYIQAAVKKPFENAPSTEISDFLDEIATMKKIVEHGGHKNVIKLLACVTLEQPYMMVMELAPCGSLKSYLTNMRKQLEERTQETAIRRDHRHFFPDNMIVEHFLPGQATDSEKLKYTHLIFNDYTESASTSESNSYVTPDSPQTPSTPGSAAETKLPMARRKQKFRKNFNDKLLPSCIGQYSPLTPNSCGSSGLPSVTETVMTSLDSTPTTPIRFTAETNNVKSTINSEKLQNFALQIANGMAFLESLNITHRDLATRNILLNHEGVLKISDFGMARAGVYVNNIQKRQPLRWMAPEAIEKRTCNNKTDVWSFGVVLWEIGSLGAFPYKELSNDQVIAYVLQGKRLERPETCTDQLYELMLRCWQTCPEQRPKFTDISRQLDVENGKLYVDFGETLRKYDILSQTVENA